MMLRVVYDENLCQSFSPPWKQLSQANEDEKPLKTSKQLNNSPAQISLHSAGDNFYLFVIYICFAFNRKQATYEYIEDSLHRPNNQVCLHFETL